MKKEWKNYLTTLGFEEPLMDRAKLALRFYTEIVDLHPRFLFVSEYRDKEDRPVFESMWLCDSSRAGEVKNFFRCPYIRLCFLEKWDHLLGSYYIKF